MKETNIFYWLQYFSWIVTLQFIPLPEGKQTSSVAPPKFLHALYTLNTENDEWINLLCATMNHTKEWENDFLDWNEDKNWLWLFAGDTL